MAKQQSAHVPPIKFLALLRKNLCNINKHSFFHFIYKIITNFVLSVNKLEEGKKPGTSPTNCCWCPLYLLRDAKNKCRSTSAPYYK